MIRLAKARAMAGECASLLRNFKMTETELGEAAEIIDALATAVAVSSAAIKIVDDPPLEKTAAKILSRHGNIEGWSQDAESSILLDYIEAACSDGLHEVTLENFNKYLNMRHVSIC